MKGTIFVSYRHRDLPAAAANVEKALRAFFGEESVFRDTVGIGGGEDIPEEILRALENCRVLVLVIGPNWLSDSDQYARRRIDSDGDWVRREIRTALAKKILVIPVLVGSARLPPKEALPSDIAALADRRKIDLRDEYFDDDVGVLRRAIEEHLHQKSKASRVQSLFPIPKQHVPTGMTEAEIARAMELLEDWEVRRSSLSEGNGEQRTELCRDFVFDSFRDCVQFMYELVPQIDAMDHHPRWENLWKTLMVRLTTWDIGHKISDRDIVLARYFDRAYQGYLKNKETQGQKA